MRVNLPMAALRSFVAIAQEGSMVGAARRVFLTQSGLSLQIKRLEDLLQVSLFHRHGRQLALSDDGRKLLGLAEELLQLNDEAVERLSGANREALVRIGVVQDFAEGLLASALTRFGQQQPSIQTQIRVAASRDLREMIASDRLDLAICVAHAPSLKAVGEVEMVWMGEAALADREVVPLVLLEEPCIFRSAALSALEQAGRRYQVVMETESLAALAAAVGAGLGLTCRTDLSAMAQNPLPVLTQGLPLLGRVSLVVEARPMISPPVRKLQDVVVATIRGLTAGRPTGGQGSLPATAAR